MGHRSLTICGDPGNEMDWASNEVIEVLVPDSGLIVSWVFHGLTFHAKPSDFNVVFKLHRH